MSLILTFTTACKQSPDGNPYGLSDGVKFFVLEVEDWTQSTTKKKLTSKKSPEKTIGTQERSISPPPADSLQANVASPESLGATRSPTSHYFPVRVRSNSGSAGPSSLSKLLAQANPIETLPENEPLVPPTKSRSPSPVPSAQPPPSPNRRLLLSHSPSVPSPLRPGSRSSSSSRFSGGRIPPFPASVSSGSSGPPKAAPTTALSSAVPASSASSASFAAVKEQNGQMKKVDIPSTPSPADSTSDGLSSMLLSQRRTTSEYQSSVMSYAKNAINTGGPSATKALANLASNLGMSITRRRTESTTSTTSTSAQIRAAVDNGNTDTPNSTTARAADLLRRF